MSNLMNCSPASISPVKTADALKVLRLADKNGNGTSTQELARFKSNLDQQVKDLQRELKDPFNSRVRRTVLGQRLERVEALYAASSLLQANAPSLTDSSGKFSRQAVKQAASKDGNAWELSVAYPGADLKSAYYM